MIGVMLSRRRQVAFSLAAALTTACCRETRSLSSLTEHWTWRPMVSGPVAG